MEGEDRFSVISSRATREHAINFEEITRGTRPPPHRETLIDRSPKIQRF